MNSMKATPGQCPGVQCQLSCNQGLDVCQCLLAHLPFALNEDTCSSSLPHCVPELKREFSLGQLFFFFLTEF